MSNYSNGLYRDYEKLQVKSINQDNEIKLLKLRVDVAESEQHRLEKKLQEKESNEINYQKEIEALKNKIIEQAHKLNLTEYERDKYLAKLGIDGTNAGIPTSQTPIKNKVK